MNPPLLVGLFTACLAGSTLAQPPARAARPEAIKVEPPSWWPGHSINPVRVMVRGRNLAGARIENASPGLEAGPVPGQPARARPFRPPADEPEGQPRPS